MIRIIKQNTQGYILRLEYGDELMESIKMFARKNNIKGGWFWAIGASDKIEIAFYNLKKKKYIRKSFAGSLEIINITGNISTKGDELVIHAHGAFGTPNFGAIGGHIFYCRISATCEIYLVKLKKLDRKIDSFTGLNLLY
jgi:predicted DNA-binding protein with PD1-like motif